MSKGEQGVKHLFKGINLLSSPERLKQLCHTQGYITLNKYITAIASIGLPKVNLWATKCVT